MTVPWPPPPVSLRKLNYNTVVRAGGEIPDVVTADGVLLKYEVVRTLDYTSILLLLTP